MVKSMSSMRCTLFIVSICLLQSYTSAQNKIAGGDPTDISKYPYLVYLRYNGGQQCAGTLVSREYVVTAASCVDVTTADQITVVGGATYISEPGIRRGVARIIYPAAYNRDTQNMNIAVLRLKQPMTGANTKPIDLCTTTMQQGESVTIPGWGKLAANLAYPDRLRVVSLPLILKGTCIDRYKDIRTLTDTMFCAQAPGKGTCNADTGSPAVKDGQFCGIVINGLGCAQGYPDVFTSVKATTTFIRNAMTY